MRYVLREQSAYRVLTQPEAVATRGGEAGVGLNALGLTSENRHS